MAEDRIVQKDEIGVVRPAWNHVTRKREARIALLPDCGAWRPRATVTWR